MARNLIGKNIVIGSFGESHGVGIGVFIDGFPANFSVDIEKIQFALNRRKPGQNQYTTSRNESDDFQVMSGIFENKTTGSPIVFFIPNTDSKSKDYDNLKDVYRPGHADATYDIKYGHRDHRGGGRSSARITAGWVAAGALAMQCLEQQNIQIRAWVQQVHTIKVPKHLDLPSIEQIDSSPVRCPDPTTSHEIEDFLSTLLESGNTAGGVIHCSIHNLPAGIGEPIFGKLQAIIGQYLLNINAVKGIAFGDGFESTLKTGSENNDRFISLEEHSIISSTNRSGGSIGGISSGMPIEIDVAFKPTSSIKSSQNTINNEGESTTVNIAGRHDPCVLPRAVPIVESMVAMAILDLFLENKIYE